MNYGKIPSLTREVREELNRRMADGATPPEMAQWLNALPEVQAMLRERFDGRAISVKNVSGWKLGGHQAWLAQQETVSMVSAAIEKGAAVAEAVVKRGPYREEVEQNVYIEPASKLHPSLADHLATGLAVHYTRMLNRVEGPVDETMQSQLRGMHLLGMGVARLRRGDLAVQRLKNTLKSEGLKALELCLDEAAEFPEVKEMFKNAFKVLRERKFGIGKKQDGNGSHEEDGRTVEEEKA